MKWLVLIGFMFAIEAYIRLSVVVNDALDYAYEPDW